MRRSHFRELASTAALAPRRFPEGVEDGPKLDASCRAFIVPSRLRYLLTPPPPPPDSMWGGRARLAGPWGAQPPLGLSPARNSDTPRRNGWNGLTAVGRRRLRVCLGALETRRRDCAFWTITLPSHALDRLAEVDGWPRFQDSIRRELRRRLVRAGLPPHACAVVELQPKRTRAEGRPCPHLHVAFVGRRPGRKVWALHRSVLDRLIVVALAAAGVDGLEVGAAGNVQPVRRTVGGYLAGYMTKGGDLEPFIHDQLELIPRQWWFATRELVALADSLAVALPVRFCLWAVVCLGLNESRKGVSVSRVRVSDPRAPCTWVLVCDDPLALAEVLCDWAESPDALALRH